jgi:hypothetical protein
MQTNANQLKEAVKTIYLFLTHTRLRRGMIHVTPSLLGIREQSKCQLSEYKYT